MKNIKKLLNKNLSVILSFAIILCTILPVVSGFIGKADSAYDPALVAELKNTWKALTPSATVGDKVDATLLNQAAIGADYWSDEVPSDVRANANSIKMPIGTKATQTLQFGDEVPTNLVTAVKLSDMKDMYFYYKSTSDVYMRVSISYTDAVSDLVGVAGPFSGLFKIASSNGNWTKVSIPDFINGASSGAWANRYKPSKATCEYFSKVRLEFSTTNSLDANNGNPNVADIYVSNLYFNYDSNIYGSDSWTDEHWMFAACDADINELKNDYSEETIWNENTLVYAYKSGDELLNRVVKSFDTEPLSARYMRIEIIDVEGGIFNPTEIEALGLNNQEFNYMNLIEEKYEAYTIYLQDKNTGDVKISFSDANRYIPYEQTESKSYSINKALDNDYSTVGDLFGGKDNKESINILFDLGTLNAVDSFTFRAGSSSDYWPEKLNFYFGTDDIALFANDTKPAKAWVNKTNDENGIYTYDFVPQVAQYVRIEILECSHEYYQRFGGEKMLTVISELAVNGLELIGTSDAGVAARLVDESTGIRVDILGLRDNDVFTAVSDILITKRKVTDGEIKGITEQGIDVISDIYDIYLLDVEGNIVSDFGGRELRIYIPKNLISKQDDVFVLVEDFGELSMVEFTTQDDYYTYLSDGTSGLTVAFGEYGEFVVGSDEDETPSNMDNTVEDDADASEEEDEDADDDKPKRKKKIKVIRKNSGGDINYLWIILGAVAAVVIVAGIVIFFIILKKKRMK